MRDLGRLIRRYQRDRAFRKLVDDFHRLLDDRVFCIYEIREALWTALILKEGIKIKKMEEEDMKIEKEIERRKYEERKN